MIEKAAEKREELKRKISTLLEEKDDVKEKLETNYVIDEQLDPAKNSGIPPRLLVGVDGGSYSIPLLVSDIYLIKTYGVYLEWDERNSDYRVKRDREYRIVDIDFILPQGSSQDRITLYRQITELRAMLYGLRENALVLGDGSIESLISRPTHQKLWSLDIGGIMGCDEISSLIEEYSPLGSAIALKKIVESAEDASIAVRLELAEKACMLKKILSEIIMYGKKMIFVTKTGRSNSIFGKTVPDQYIVSQYTYKPGYIVDSPTTLKQAIEELPAYCGLKDIGEKIVLINGYARFTKGTPPMKIQAIISKEEYKSLAKSYLEIYRDNIRGLSKATENGYPIPLFLAHQKAHIKKRATDLILKTLGIEEEFSGREYIEVL